MGIICPDEAPLLGFVSLIAPTIAMGNTIVVIPSRTAPVPALRMVQLFETSDIPNGVVNVLTGLIGELLPDLAKHDNVDAIWYFGDEEGSALVEKLSVSNLKRTWVSNGKYRDWGNLSQGEGKEFLYRATEIKNIWIPYGA
jgi:aldehyde dehydrogenase (NAD+)